MEDKKDIKLAETLKGLCSINLNGTQYLGKGEDIEGGVKITNAIEVTEGWDFNTALISWIKAKNLNKLEEVKIKGVVASYATKEFTDEQKMTIDIVAAKAEYAVKYAVANVENDAIDKLG